MTPPGRVFLAKMYIIAGLAVIRNLLLPLTQLPHISGELNPESKTRGFGAVASLQVKQLFHPSHPSCLNYTEGSLQ